VDVVGLSVRTAFTGPPRWSSQFSGVLRGRIIGSSSVLGAFTSVVWIVRLFSRLDCLDPIFGDGFAWDLLQHLEAVFVEVLDPLHVADDEILGGLRFQVIHELVLGVAHVHPASGIEKFVLDVIDAVIAWALRFQIGGYHRGARIAIPVAWVRGAILARSAARSPLGIRVGGFHVGCSHQSAPDLHGYIAALHAASDDGLEELTGQTPGLGASQSFG
jgi:hypothetical protein